VFQSKLAPTVASATILEQVTKNHLQESGSSIVLSAQMLLFFQNKMVRVRVRVRVSVRVRVRVS